MFQITQYKILMQTRHSVLSDIFMFMVTVKRIVWISSKFNFPKVHTHEKMVDQDKKFAIKKMATVNLNVRRKF